VLEEEGTMQDAYDALVAVGFGEYDARAYCALVSRSPANGYQVAKASGVPRAKVYECLERLVLRGAAVPVETAEGGKNGKLFAAVDFNILMEDIEKNISAACHRAKRVLSRLRREEQTVEVLTRIQSEKDLIARAQALVRESTKTLHLALWGEEFGALFPDLAAARRLGVRMSLILYSAYPGIRELQLLGAGAVLHSRTKFDAIPLVGKQFVVVADRARCIVGSIFPESETVDGVFSMNRGLVTNALDLVNHEIYLERILLEVGEPLKRLYGENLEALDAFDPPASHSRPPKQEAHAGRK
jgi:HTH-type transcriptional regulator, sugar sensing transcriptional regulator